jgi:hypothetical protein
MNVGQETTMNEEDSEVKGSTLSSDLDSHKRHTNNYESEGTTVRRVSYSFVFLISLL